MKTVWMTQIQKRIATVAKFFQLLVCTEKPCKKKGSVKQGSESSCFCSKSKSTEEVNAPVDYVKTLCFKFDWEVKRDDWN